MKNFGLFFFYRASKAINVILSDIVYYYCEFLIGLLLTVLIRVLVNLTQRMIVEND